MPTWLKVLLDIVPVFADWIQWIFGMKEEEWEKISEAWPAPTKTRLARLRYEAKLYEKAGIDKP